MQKVARRHTRPQSAQRRTNGQHNLLDILARLGRRFEEDATILLGELRGLLRAADTLDAIKSNGADIRGGLETPDFTSLTEKQTKR